MGILSVDFLVRFSPDHRLTGSLDRRDSGLRTVLSGTDLVEVPSRLETVLFSYCSPSYTKDPSLDL